jgi:hypothetical protein
MPSYTYAVKEHHLDKQKKYTDKVLMSSKTKQRERETSSAKEQKSSAPSTRNLQTRVALFAPLERGNVLARIETFRLGGGWKDDDGTDDEKNLEKKFLHFICFAQKKMKRAVVSNAPQPPAKRKEKERRERRGKGRRSVALSLGGSFAAAVFAGRGSSSSRSWYSFAKGVEERKFVTNGYSMRIPEEEYAYEETEGVATSTLRVRDERGREVLSVRRERTGTMGNYGLRSMFPDVDAFGETMKGRYKNDEEGGEREARELDGSGMYAIELSGNRIVGVVVGCKDGESGRRFNQMQTISALAEVKDEKQKSDVWGMLESLRLTAGKTCSE